MGTIVEDTPKQYRETLKPGGTGQSEEIGVPPNPPPPSGIYRQTYLKVSLLDLNLIATVSVSTGENETWFH